MEVPLFAKRPITVIWDFDKTLIPGSMQRPLFEHFGIDEGQFWREANDLPAFYRQQRLDLVSDDTLYLNHILSYVRAGKFPGLSNALLRELGAKLEFYPGLPDLFETTRKRVADDQALVDLGIQVEHYILSAGLRQMIQGSSIAEHADGIWACEFAEKIAEPGYVLDDEPSEPESGQIEEIVYTLNDTTKTRAIFEINKGVNHDERIDVNAAIAIEDRRVPFENMIYIADGPSDIPVFSIVKRFGGRTYAVYQPGSQSEFDQVSSLAEQERVDAFGEANYEPGTQTEMWITRAIDRAATAMVEAWRAEHEASLVEKVGAPPGHLSSDPAPESHPDNDHPPGG